MMLSLVLARTWSHTMFEFFTHSVTGQSTRLMHGKTYTDLQPINQFHHRFCEVPTFGRDTIRRFGGNVSAMKKLAGRDFEDILQVIVVLLFSPDPS